MFHNSINKNRLLVSILGNKFNLDVCTVGNVETSVTLSNKSGYSNSYSLSSGQSKTDYFIIYGKIPVQPVSPQGTYTDTVTLVLDY